MGWVEGALAEAADLRGINNLMVDLVDARRSGCSELLEICVRWRSPLPAPRSTPARDIIGLGDAVASQVSPAHVPRICAALRAAHLRRRHRPWAPSPACTSAATPTTCCADMVASGADIVDLDWMVDMRAGGSDRTAWLLCGNFDPVAVFLQGTPEEVRARRLRQRGRGWKALDFWRPAAKSPTAPLPRTCSRTTRRCSRSRSPSPPGERVDLAGQAGQRPRPSSDGPRSVSALTWYLSMNAPRSLPAGVVAFAAAFAALHALHAQVAVGSGQATSQPTIFIDASVTDGSGRPVTTLRPEELRVSVDGQLRKVVSLRYVCRGPGADVAAALVARTTNGAAAAERARLLLLLADENAIARGQQTVQEKIIKTYYLISRFKNRRLCC